MGASVEGAWVGASVTVLVGSSRVVVGAGVLETLTSGDFVGDRTDGEVVAANVGRAGRAGIATGVGDAVAASVGDIVGAFVVSTTLSA